MRGRIQTKRGKNEIQESDNCFTRLRGLTINDKHVQKNLVRLLILVLEFLDAWLWMGWHFQKIPGGFTVHVVAFKPCSGVFIQVFYYLFMAIYAFCLLMVMKEIIIILKLILCINTSTDKLF